MTPYRTSAAPNVEHVSWWRRASRRVRLLLKRAVGICESRGCMRYGRSSTVIEDGRPYQIPGYCPHHARVMYDMIQSAWAERQAEEVRAFYSYAAHVYEQMEGRKP